MLINRVKIYTNLSPEIESQSDNVAVVSQLEAECVGNKHATICCIVNCSSPLSESKDYKTLTKVFEKLMLKIENVYLVNVKDCKSINFVHFIHEFSFSKIFIFGEDALLNNIPIRLTKFKPSKYELYNILLAENLVTLTESSDLDMKAKSWEAIKGFYRS
jgi:hypothetical protein